VRIVVEAHDESSHDHDARLLDVAYARQQVRTGLAVLSDVDLLARSAQGIGAGGFDAKEDTVESRALHGHA